MWVQPSKSFGRSPNIFRFFARPSEPDVHQYFSRTDWVGAAIEKAIGQIEPMSSMALRRRRAMNFARLARFEPNDTTSVLKAKAAPTNKLWVSQNGVPTRKNTFMRVVEAWSRAKLPIRPPVKARAEGIPCHVTTERNPSRMRLAPYSRRTT